MSWSIYVIGRPEAVCRKIDKDLEQLTGNSQKELAEVAPGLKAIVMGNVGGEVVSVVASGHASFNDAGEKTYGNCQVEIKKIPGQFVE